MSVCVQKRENCGFSHFVEGVKPDVFQITEKRNCMDRPPVNATDSIHVLEAAANPRLTSESHHVLFSAS